MAEKMPIRIRERTVCVAGVINYVRSARVPAGEMWCLQHIAYENETLAAGTFRRFIDNKGYEHYIAELQGPGLGELIHTDKDMWLMPGEALAVRQAGCGAGNIISLYADGYRTHTPFIED